MVFGYWSGRYSRCTHLCCINQNRIYSKGYITFNAYRTIDAINHILCDSQRTKSTLHVIKYIVDHIVTWPLSYRSRGVNCSNTVDFPTKNSIFPKITQIYPAVVRCLRRRVYNQSRLGKCIRIVRDRTIFDIFWAFFILSYQWIRNGKKMRVDWNSLSR